jgi:hypothetical protein
MSQAISPVSRRQYGLAAVASGGSRGPVFIGARRPPALARRVVVIALPPQVMHRQCRTPRQGVVRSDRRTCKAINWRDF